MTATDTPTISPFKFLDAYTASDAGLFFGREAEQRSLVELIFSAKLVLVYGASGTGKSSLVQCGLAQTLSLTDYFPVLIRRRGDFNASLRTTLRGILGEEDESSSPVELIQRLSRQALRPVYLLFDQFEEVFISGTQEEQLALISTLQTVYEADVACKLLIIMREEYIARLSLFEQTLPQLFDFRLRVEAMRERNLEEVIIRTFQAIEEVSLLAPNETAPAIIQNIALDKSLFQLPYLQVYLDRLWRLGQRQADQTGKYSIVIDPPLVASVGPIENVLETFLREQKKALIQSAGPDADAMPTAVDKVLESFVTYEGTRREQRLTRLQAETGLPQPTIRSIVQWLEAARLLREDESTYELPHDSLALVIDKGRSATQRRLNDLLRRLKDSFQEYTANPNDDFLLTARRLAEVRDLETPLREELDRTMPTESKYLWGYVDQSEQYHQRRQAEKLDAQQAKYRQLQRTVVGVGFLMVVALVACGVAWMRTSEAQQATKRANAFYWTSESVNLPPMQAVRLLEKATGYNVTEGPVYEQLFRRFNEWDAIPIYKHRPHLALTHQGAVLSAVFSPDEHHILTASKDNSAKLWNLNGSKPITLVHQATVFSAVFSPNGHQLLTASADKTAKLWDLNGKPLTTLSHKGAVYSAVFSPDGKRVLSASEDRTAKLWDPSGKLLATLPHAGVVVSAVFSPDGRQILTASDDHTAKLWDLKGTVLATLPHGGTVYSAVFSPDGKQVLTASLNNVARRWTTGGKLLATFAHDEPVYSAVFSPDGKQILTASADKTAKLWSLSGQKISTLSHQKDVYAAVFSPDGKRILTASADHTARLWDVNAGNSVTLAHKGAVYSAVFSRNGRHILTASADNSAELWDIKQQLTYLSHQRAVFSAIFSPDGRHLLSASADSTARLWDLTGKTIVTLGHKGLVRLAVFSPDGKRILTASADSTARLWDLRGKLLATYAHEGPVLSAVFSSDGRYILSGSLDNTARLWNVNGKALASLSHKGFVFSVVFSPDGRHLLTGSMDNMARLWDTKGTLIRELVHKDGIYSVSFSPDGSRLLTASLDSTAKLWDITGNLLANLSHEGPVYSAVFSPDGKQILTASADKTARLWNLSGQRLATLAHQDAVLSAVFSRDGHQMLTASADSTARLWNLNGQRLATLAHQGRVFSAVFGPDGQHMLTASEDKSAKLWLTAEGILTWLRQNNSQLETLSEENKKKYRTE